MAPRLRKWLAFLSLIRLCKCLVRQKLGGFIVLYSAIAKRKWILALIPKLGLLIKYLSVDQELLVEIIQDTVGRHDTFGLACTARYYEDLGYTGHVNC